MHRDGCHLPCRMSASGCFDMCHEPCHPCQCMWLVLCFECIMRQTPTHALCKPYQLVMGCCMVHLLQVCIYILVMMHVDACMPVTYMHNSLCFLMYNGCCDDSFHFIEFINRASSYWASHSSFILSGIGFIFIWKLDHMNLFMI